MTIVLFRSTGCYDVVVALVSTVWRTGRLRGLQKQEQKSHLHGSETVVSSLDVPRHTCIGMLRYEYDTLVWHN